LTGQRTFLHALTYLFESSETAERVTRVVGWRTSPRVEIFYKHQRSELCSAFGAGVTCFHGIRVFAELDGQAVQRISSDLERLQAGI
jgi:hypothetical protein